MRILDFVSGLVIAHSNDPTEVTFNGIEATFNSVDENIYRRGLMDLVTYDALSPESSEYFLSLLMKNFLRAPLGVHIQKSVEIYTSRITFL